MRIAAFATGLTIAISPAAAADKANFEIVPLMRQTSNADALQETWFAVLLDHRDNRAFYCNGGVDRRRNSVGANCTEVPEYAAKSNMTKGADVQTATSEGTPVRPVGRAIWQIDKQNGSASFCTIFPPPANCVDITPKY